MTHSQPNAIGLILMLTLTSIAQAIVPVPGPSPASPTVIINASPGQQNDPHVSGDLVSYTDQAGFPQIRYYNFATGIDSAINNVLPDGTLAVDILSDVSGPTIAFTRQTGTSSKIMLFNTGTLSTSEVDPAMEPKRMGVAIGGNTLAYVDVTGTGDIVAWDLSTSTRQIVSAAAAYESNPNVSPDGKVIVWEYCVTSTSNCDVYQAVNTAGSWVVSPTSNTATPEANPDTDGVIVVYDADRAGSSTGQDIFFRPVAGGAEVQIELPGLQRNPSVKNGVIAFESVAPGATFADICVYLIASNTLLQITHTPGNETLNDIDVLANGDIRLVWSADDVDIVATTFTPPPPVTACQMRVDELVKRDGIAMVPYAGADTGQGGTGLRLVSLGRIRNAVGQDAFTVWLIRNSSSRPRSVTLNALQVVNRRVTLYQRPLDVRQTTDTIVSSPVVAAFATHLLFEGTVPIDVKPAREDLFSDGHNVFDPKCGIQTHH